MKMKKNWKYLAVLVCVVGSLCLVISNFNSGIVSKVDAQSASKGKAKLASEGLGFDLLSSTTSPEPGAKIYGYVYDRSTTNPIPDAAVTLKDKKGKKLDSASSDSWGHYLLSTETSGNLKVSVSHSKYSSASSKVDISSKEVKASEKFVENFGLKKKKK